MTVGNPLGEGDAQSAGEGGQSAEKKDSAL